ncbi:MAG: acyl carrier protein [Gammaproteobacteria bacterium]|nr:acyl carrier protein [Gammaproteobacteria bacterium]
MEDAEKKLALLIIDALNLRLKPDDIDPEEALFNSGLGLDSIDALEIAVAIEIEYGVKIQAQNENNVKIMSSLRSLSRHITKQIENA